MADQNEPTSSFEQTYPNVSEWARHSRLLIISGLTVFGVSLLFPIVASLTPTDVLPMWIGWLDVTLAFGVIGLMIGITALARGKIDEPVKQLSYRVYRGLANLPIILVIIFFAFGNRIKWDVLLVGLAWRLWVLLYVLPAGLAVWRIAVGQHKKS